ncbi:hypothetical protein MATL_G00196760 [Megalops atlanticus]|uniref:Chemokine interleukin-8-like domain-containing protein n=1 Tax=Megalops atlanticus TaxID=7932 RepID=A0A9D3PJL9_MEGAT|nr:hypothetical protein MATL_G00196760 [Megalops atlanticus]
MTTVCTRLIAAALIMYLLSLPVTQALELRCRCVQTESRPLGKWIQSVKLIEPGPHCRHHEIIATLKKTKQKVCLNPKAPWVITFLRKFEVQLQK